MDIIQAGFITFDATPAVPSYLLLEIGDKLLLETGDGILLE